MGPSSWPRIFICSLCWEGWAGDQSVHSQSLGPSTFRKTWKGTGRSVLSCSALQVETRGLRRGRVAPGFLTQGQAAIFIQRECEGKAVARRTKHTDEEDRFTFRQRLRAAHRRLTWRPVVKQFKRDLLPHHSHFVSFLFFHLIRKILGDRRGRCGWGHSFSLWGWD